MIIYICVSEILKTRFSNRFLVYTIHMNLCNTVKVFKKKLFFYATQIITIFLIQGSQSCKRIVILPNHTILILLNVPLVQNLIFLEQRYEYKTEKEQCLNFIEIKTMNLQIMKILIILNTIVLITFML